MTLAEKEFTVITKKWCAWFESNINPNICDVCKYRSDC